MSNETAAKYDIIHCSQQVRADNLTTCYRKKKLMSVFHASNLLLIMNCQSSLRIHSAIASWIHSYFDNVRTKLMINNRTDTLKTDVNSLIGQRFLTFEFYLVLF